MADHLPFVYTRKDCEFVKRFYADSIAIRFTLDNVDEISSHLPQGPQSWIDPAIDGLHLLPNLTPDYETYIDQFNGIRRLVDSSFQEKPEKGLVQQLVSALLDQCMQHSPGWLSVPQLPRFSNASRNKLNRLLAESTATWKTRANLHGKLILPVIITHQSQINRKTERNKQLRLLSDCFQLCGADGVWVVESTLSDQDGTSTFEHVRFPGIIAFHQEISSVLPSETLTVAGPYWGLNLILWARGLVTFPAIGLGNSYQYHLHGGRLMAGKKRIALPPLKRWAVASSHLEGWLRRCLRHLDKQDPALGEFSSILQNFAQLSIDGRPQVAAFYKSWFDKIAGNPAPGRALALYQELSSAYVVGKSLPDLPAAEGTGKKAWRVAKQFMVNCL